MSSTKSKRKSGPALPCSTTGHNAVPLGALSPLGSLGPRQALPPAVAKTASRDHGGSKEKSPSLNLDDLEEHKRKDPESFSCGDHMISEKKELISSSISGIVFETRNKKISLKISTDEISPHSSEICQTVRPQNMFLQKISSMSRPQRSSPSLPHRSLQCLRELWDLWDLGDLRCLWCLRWFWRLRHVHLQQWRSQLPPAVDETRNTRCLN